MVLLVMVSVSLSNVVDLAEGDVGTGLVRREEAVFLVVVSVFPLDVVLLAGDDVCTWLVRGEAVSPVVVFVSLSDMVVLFRGKV